MYFFGGLQAWEERTAFTEIDYIVHYHLDQSKPVFDILFPSKPYFAVLLALPSQPTFKQHLVSLSGQDHKNGQVLAQRVTLNATSILASKLILEPQS